MTNSRNVLIGLIIGLLIGAAATYVLAAPGLSRTTTVTSVISTTTTMSVTQTSTATEGTGANASALSSNGLRLSTSINATQFTVGQGLNISISLVNTQPTPNALCQVTGPALCQVGSPLGNWTFYGVPVSTWPECSATGLHEGWLYPIDILIINGTYTAQQLSLLANVSLSAGPCATSVVFPTYTFEPNSNLVNITYFADGGVGFGKAGIYRAATSFVVGGDWNLTSLQQNTKASDADQMADYCISAVALFCRTPQSSPLVAGEYTIAVSDEWGQYDVLHFQVSGPG